MRSQAQLGGQFPSGQTNQPFAPTAAYGRDGVFGKTLTGAHLVCSDAGGGLLLGAAGPM